MPSKVQLKSLCLLVQLTGGHYVPMSISLKLFFSFLFGKPEKGGGGEGREPASAHWPPDGRNGQSFHLGVWGRSRPWAILHHSYSRRDLASTALALTGMPERQMTALPAKPQCRSPYTFKKKVLIYIKQPESETDVPCWTTPRSVTLLPPRPQQEAGLLGCTCFLPMHSFLSKTA